MNNPIEETAETENFKMDSTSRIYKYASVPALAGRVSVGELAFIGVNASIREDVVIGDNATVGIGSVVLQNIPDNTVWAGNPALFLKNQ